MTFDFAASGPARHDTAVVFCCDGAYAPFALHAAAQIDRLHPQRSFDLVLCSDAPVDLPQGPGLPGMRRIVAGIGDTFAGLRRDARRSPAVYLPLALPDLLGDDYRRILYLDADIHVAGGDLAALLEVDLGPHGLGAVRDNIQWRTPHRRPREFRASGWPAAPYLNSGVLLIDTARWRSDDLLARMLGFGRRHPDRVTSHDQTLLNCVLRGGWAELSPVWNWQYTWSSRLAEAMTDANIVHFIGPRKPWKDEGGQLPPRFARALNAFLGAHVPDRPPVPVPQGAARDPALFRRMALRHALSASRTARYLARFPHDLAVDTAHPRP